MALCLMILQVKMNPYMNIWLILSNYFNVESNHFTPFFISMFYEMAYLRIAHSTKHKVSCLLYRDKTMGKAEFLI